jgi:hypothetical protein
MAAGTAAPRDKAAGTAAPQIATLGDYRLVVHCGACMWNRREMLTRMAACRRAGVPICNYGMTIAYTLGIFDRALGPFPDALEAYRELKSSRGRAADSFPRSHAERGNQNNPFETFSI